MLDALAVVISRRARRIPAVAVVFVAVPGVFGGPVVGLLDAEDDFDDPAAEAIRGHDALLEATGAEPRAGLVALVGLGAPADSPAAREKLDRVEDILRSEEQVAIVEAPRGDAATRAEISTDGRSAFLSALHGRIGLREDAGLERVRA